MISVALLDGLAHLGYIGLFAASFLAATILPFSSEAVMAGVIAAGLNIWTCVAVATLGNSLGGMTCYWIGSFGRIEWMERYLKVKHERVEKMRAWLNGRGAIMSIFVFLPGVGDIIAVALGFMRANPWLVFLFMTLGKFGRYVVVAVGIEKLIGLF